MTERLNIIYELLPKCEKFSDIGCDHGYITKAMLDGGKCKFAVASDVSDKCLNKARDTLKQEILSEKAVCILSNGFDNLPETDLALISGMGGEEIVSILLKAKTLPKVLVLQPMKNTDKVRTTAQNLGYKITVDFTFKADGKFYDIIKIEKGVKAKKLNKKEIRYGKDNLKNKPLAFIEKLNARISVLNSCLDKDNLNKKAHKTIKKELKELIKYAKP